MAGARLDLVDLPRTQEGYDQLVRIAASFPDDSLKKILLFISWQKGWELDGVKKHAMMVLRLLYPDIYFEGFNNPNRFLFTVLADGGYSPDVRLDVLIPERVFDEIERLLSLLASSRVVFEGPVGTKEATEHLTRVWQSKAVKPSDVHVTYAMQHQAEQVLPIAPTPPDTHWAIEAYG